MHSFTENNIIGKPSQQIKSIFFSRSINECFSKLYFLLPCIMIIYVFLITFFETEILNWIVTKKVIKNTQIIIINDNKKYSFDKHSLIDLEKKFGIICCNGFPIILFSVKECISIRVTKILLNKLNQTIQQIRTYYNDSELCFKILDVDF